MNKLRLRWIIISFCILCFSFLNAFKVNSEADSTESSKNLDIAQYALQYLNDTIKPRKAFDCSGFTRSVYSFFYINLPQSSREQAKLIECTDIEKMGAGDLVFFKINGKNISHVGIYLCNNKFIHSPGRHDKIRIDSLTHVYWKKRFFCGGPLKNCVIN